MGAHRWLRRAGLLVLSVLLVGTIWCVPYLPTTDGPEWIFATHAENHYGDAGAPYAAAFVPALQFASRGMSVVLGPLDAWFGWRRGVQVALSVIVLGAAWGFVALVRAVNDERSALAFLGFPLALSWEFYMGFWPFVVSLVLGLFILALAVHMRAVGLVGRALLGLLLLAQAVLHVFGAVIVGCVVGWLFVARARRGGRLAELGRVALMGAPAACILAACAWLSRDIVNAPLVRDVTFLSLTESLATLPRVVLPGPWARALVASTIIVSAGAIAAVRAGRRTTTPDDRALGIAAVALLVAGALGPLQIPGWQFFSQRFVPTGAALVLVTLPLEHLMSRVRRMVPPSLFAAAAASLLLSYPFNRRLVALCPSAVEGLATAVRSRGEILAVTLRPTEHPSYSYITAEVPFMNPLLHMGTLYAVVLGGVPALSFTGVQAIHAFIRRPSGRPVPSTEHYAEAIGSQAFVHDVTARDTVLGELATYGMYYEEVAVFGSIPSDVRLWRARGFESDWQSGATLLSHFVPCTVDFVVAADAVDPAPSFDVGAGDVKVLSDLRASPVIAPDGLAHFELGPSPCGRISIIPRWPTGRACAGADSEGRLRAVVTRSSRTVACDAE